MLLENSPSGTWRGQYEGSNDGPSGCACMRYQKPKCVPPAAALCRTVLFGFVIQNAAGVMSSFCGSNKDDGQEFHEIGPDVYFSIDML